MSELQEATLLLINSPIRYSSTFDREVEETPRTPPSPSVHPSWSIPSHLLRIPDLRDAALRAAESGKAASEAPTDFTLLLQHALQLQQLASRLPASSSDDQLTLLHRACELYGRAKDIRQGRSSIVYFNWAVALSDIARLVKPVSPGEAVEYLSAAALKYAAAVSLDPLNPQALNNWGLILQDLAALLPPQQRHGLTVPAVDRFRAAMRLHPDVKLTSRFSYNLGTVLYADACIMAETLSNANGANSASKAQQQQHALEDRRIKAAFAHAAMYMILAYALQPDTKVYQDALPAVQRLLPLPFLQTGALTVAVPGTADSPREAWVPAWFALDVHTLQSVRAPPAEARKIAAGASVPNIAIDIADITAMHVCQDPTLPEGWAVWLGLKDKPGGMYLVASEREEAEGWVDALTLLGLLSKTPGGGADQLQQALLVRGRQQRKQTGGGGDAAGSKP